MRAKCFLGAGLMMVAAAGAAASDKGRHTEPSWQWTSQAGAVFQAESGLDSGGDIAVSRYFVEAGGARVFVGGWRVGFSLGYGEDSYDFSGSAGFGGLAPWGRVRDLRVSAPLQYALGDEWSFYAIPSLRFNAETGASLDDGQTTGLLAGTTYRVSERLTIGPGIGVFSELENDVSVFPLLLVDWKITDNLSLETGRGFAASRGPGLQLRWAYSPRWQFAFGGRYESTRFRLDDAGIAPDGVGEDKAVPLFAVADLALSPDATLSLFGGAEVAGVLRLEDSAGRLVSESDQSTAPFLGASLRVRF